MGKYRVTYEKRLYVTIDIEADSPKQAHSTAQAVDFKHWQSEEEPEWTQYDVELLEKPS